MARDLIGLARCPFCRSEKAKLKLSAKGLAFMHCDSCNMQAFARSDRSDDGMRALLIAPAASPAPVPAPAPAPAAPQPAPAAETGKKPMSWGVLGGT